MTRGVRGNLVGEKLRCLLSSRQREASGSESWPAPDLWKLGWHPPDSPQSNRKVRSGDDVGVSPGDGGRCGGWGPNPFRRFSPSPAQAGGAASGVRTGDRAVTWLCSWAVLVAEVDERRPVQVYFRARAASSHERSLGSGHPASRTGGERALTAGHGGDIVGLAAGCLRFRAFSRARRKPSAVAGPEVRASAGASWSGGGSTRRGKAS